jgi:hypothetical protein
MADHIASSMALASRCTMQADLLYHRQLELIEDLADSGVPTYAAEHIAGLMLEHRDQCHEWLKSLIRSSESAPSIKPCGGNTTADLRASTAVEKAN